MKLRVVPERCVAAGSCVDVAPTYFDQREEDGIVELLRDDVDAADEEDVEDAIEICPARAIERL